MTIKFIKTIIYGTGAHSAYTLTGSGSVLFVTNTGGLLATGGASGILSEGDDQSITLDGVAYGAPGVALLGTGAVLTVGSTGEASGSYGVQVYNNLSLSSDDQIVNAGHISGQYVGVQFSLSGGNSLANTGLISSQRIGVSLVKENHSDSIDNSGTILGDAVGISFFKNIASEHIVNSGTLSASAAYKSGTAEGALYFDDAGETDTVDNTGTIDSLGYAIVSAADSLDISNAGTIDGGLSMEGGAAGGTLTLDNTGLWQQGAGGFGLQLLGNTTNSLTNSGTIDANIVMTSGDNAVTNSGKISGLVEFTGSGGSDLVTNSGAIVGEIAFGGAASELVNAKAGAVTGYVDFLGADSILLNGGAIDGPVNMIAGSDTLSNWGVIDGPLNLSSASGGVAVTNTGSLADGVTYGTGVESSLINGTHGVVTGAVVLAGAYASVKNSGAIDGSVTLSGATGTNTLTNMGTIDGNVSMTGTQSVVINHGQIYGNVALAGHESLTDTGIIHGDVTLGADDTFNASRGEVTDTVMASTSDLFAYSGNFGNETIDSFTAGSSSTHDMLQFAANDFGSYAAVKAAMTQVGLDVTIRLDATDSIVLNMVTLGSLVAADFKFV